MDVTDLAIPGPSPPPPASPPPTEGVLSVPRDGGNARSQAMKLKHNTFAERLHLLYLLHLTESGLVSTAISKESARTKSSIFPTFPPFSIFYSVVGAPRRWHDNGGCAGIKSSQNYVVAIGGDDDVTTARMIMMTTSTMHHI